jgi:hypothetical protein
MSHIQPSGALLTSPRHTDTHTHRYKLIYYSLPFRLPLCIVFTPNMDPFPIEGYPAPSEAYSDSFRLEFNTAVVQLFSCPLTEQQPNSSTESKTPTNTQQQNHRSLSLYDDVCQGVAVGQNMSFFIHAATLAISHLSPSSPIFTSLKFQQCLSQLVSLPFLHIPSLPTHPLVSISILLI